MDTTATTTPTTTATMAHLIHENGIVLDVGPGHVRSTRISRGLILLSRTRRHGNGSALVLVARRLALFIGNIGEHFVCVGRLWSLVTSHDTNPVPVPCNSNDIYFVMHRLRRRWRRHGHFWLVSLTVPQAHGQGFFPHLRMYFFHDHGPNHGHGPWVCTPPCHKNNSSHLGSSIRICASRL